MGIALNDDAFMILQIKVDWFLTNISNVFFKYEQPKHKKSNFPVPLLTIPSCS